MKARWIGLVGTMVLLGFLAGCTIDVTVGNQEPVAMFTLVPANGFAPLTVGVNASQSYDMDGDIISYEWDFGDGSEVATGKIATHTYQDHGSYTVTLAVRDDYGAYDFAYLTVEVANPAPVSRFSFQPGNPLTRENVVFDASASYDPAGLKGIVPFPTPTARIVSYAWDFGDNTAGAGSMVSHSFWEHGTYTITLTVIDNDGASSSGSQTITVANRKPVARFFWKAADYIAQGIIVTPTFIRLRLDGSSSYDPDGWIIHYLWYCDGSVIGNGPVLEKDFQIGVRYVIVLQVTDNDGEKGEVSALLEP